MRSGLTGTSLLRHGSNTGSVELTFEVDDIKHIIKRTLKRSKSSVGQESGYSVSGAGDVNGDGFDDLIVGAMNADPNGSNSGEAYVVFGKSAAFASSLNLSSLNGTTGFVIKGVAAGDLLGSSVSSAGDVNGDGFDDILIGSPGATTAAGKAFVIFGKGTAFSSNFEASSID